MKEYKVVFVNGETRIIQCSYYSFMNGFVTFYALTPSTEYSVCAYVQSMIESIELERELSDKTITIA